MAKKSGTGPGTSKLSLTSRKDRPLLRTSRSRIALKTSYSRTAEDPHKEEEEISKAGKKKKRAKKTAKRGRGRGRKDR